MSSQQLESVLERSSGELVYGFMATRTGDLVAEAGDRNRLSHQAIVNTILQPEQAAGWYETIADCERQDPRLIPQLYSLGTTQAVLGVPEDGILLGVLGMMPEAVWKGSPKDRATWLWQFRTRTWATIRTVWSLTTPWE